MSAVTNAPQVRDLPPTPTPTVGAAAAPARSGRRSARGSAPRAARGPRHWGRWTFLSLLAVYFIVPQLAMARFAFQKVPVVLLTWDTIGDGWSVQPLVDALKQPELWSAVRTSLMLGALAVLLNLLLLVPLAVIAEVRSPWLRPVLTGVTLLPWVVPPIALVVGVAATFRPAAPWFLSSIFSLVPFYAVWALPFTYRALDAGLRAVNARTLVEAARSLGASPVRVMTKVLLPSLGPSIVATAGLTFAFVLGEFAFAGLLLKKTLPTYMVTFQKGAPQAGMALALAVLVLTALAISAVVHLLRRRGVGTTTVGV